MNEDSILQKLISLRKGVMTRFVPPILKLTHVVAVAENTLFLNRAPSKGPMPHLSALVGFLSLRLFQFLPPKHAVHAVDDLSLPLLSVVLESFQSEIPNSIGHLPSYITFVRGGVQFEESVNALRKKYETEDRLRALEILTEWSLSLHCHYEKKRRQTILEDARKIIVDQRKLAGARIDKSEAPAPQYLPSVTHPSGDSVPDSARIVDGSMAGPAEADIIDDDGGDGWGFDDEGLEPAGDNVPDSSSLDVCASTTEIEEVDPWDGDPWDDPSSADPSSVESSQPVSEPSSNLTSLTAPTPKTANGLGKFKGKSKNISSSSSLEQPSGVTSSTLPIGPSEPNLISGTSASQSNGVHPPPPLAPPVVETYLVSECARSLLTLCESIVQEGYELSTSG